MDGDNIVAARLRALAEYISDLQELRDVTPLGEYRENKLARQAVERTLHTAIGACLGSGHRIIATQKLRSPADNPDVFAFSANRRSFRIVS